MPTATESKPLSAFERRRLDNIAANRALLSDISSSAPTIAAPKPFSRTRSKKTRAKSRSDVVKREPAPRTRMSSRLAGIEASDELQKRKLEVEAEHQAERHRAKRLRVSEDQALDQITVEGARWGGAAGIGGLAGLVKNTRPGLRTFTEDDVKETTDKDLKELRVRMSGLALYEKWPPSDIKIVPQRIYSLGFHPTEDKPIIFAGDKEGAMGVFDASQRGPAVDDDDDEQNDQVPKPIVAAFKTHARTISSFLFAPVDANAVYSSSYDSSIRKVDLAQGVSVQIYAPPKSDEDMPISTIDMTVTDPHSLYFSTLTGMFGRHDVRSPSSSKNDQMWRLSDQKIGGFALHPLHGHLVATASLDRTLRVWDLRKMTGRGSESTPTLLGTHESRLSVSHASWSAGGHIATSSYDDTVKIYALPNAGGWTPGERPADEGDLAPTVKIAHNNQTGRWVTILKPQWQRQPGDGIQKLVIGNMNRFVDVFAANGSQLAQLGGDDISAVPAVAHFHPSLNWVAGGTASGKLCLWM